MAGERSYLHVLPTDVKKCLLCNQAIGNEIFTTNTVKSWLTLKGKSARWSVIDIPKDDCAYEFRNVNKKICNIEPEGAFGVKHESCRMTFYMHLERYENRYGTICDNMEIEEGDRSNDSEDTEIPSSVRTRSISSHIRSFAKLCFVCQVGEGNKGKIHHCEWSTANNLIVAATKHHEQHVNHRFYSAANRLNLQLSGPSHDTFSADIYYHLSCYSSYIRLPQDGGEEWLDVEMEQHLLNDFFTSIRLNILRDKNAYLLTQLLKDWLRLCDERGVDTRIKQTHQIKTHLQNQFPDELKFFSNAKKNSVIVYSSTMDAIEYSVAALKGEGLRDIDLAKGFAAMIRRKMSVRKQEIKNNFPYEPHRLTEELQNGPLPDLYNVIYLTIKGRCKLNSSGYAITKSNILVRKIWSLAYDWEALLSDAPNPKQVAMGMTIHRVTASKETIAYLHKCNHIISYNQILAQHNAWERMVSSGLDAYGEIYKKEVTHSSIDNNDGKQQTATGFGTTHHTNSLLFQPTKVIAHHQKSTPANIGLIERNHPGVKEIKSYAMKIKKCPPLFPNHKDDVATNLLDVRFRRDLIWSICGGIPEEADKTLPLIGSWTPFNMQVTGISLAASSKQYLPVMDKPPDYDVLKSYLEFLVDTTDHLEIDRIFTHADEAVYSKILHIMWKHGDSFKNVIPLMGGFHQLLVMMKILYKRYGVMGHVKWFKDALVIASGSVNQAIEGRHYYRCIRLHKEAFDAVIQVRVEALTDSYKLMDPVLFSKFLLLRQKPSNEIMNDIVVDEDFIRLEESIVQTTGTQSRMSLAYLKDVSLLLSLVTAARESDIDLHMEAERQMLNLIFAFDHVHYSRYNSYQHVLLSDHKQTNSPAYQDLKKSGFSAARTTGSFKGVHGDLMTEIFNGETKGTAGPFRSGYSTQMSTVNKWVRITHIHAAMRSVLKDKLQITSSSVHQECTKSHMKRHIHHVNMLKATLGTYEFDFFSTGPAVSIATGEAINSDVVNNILVADLVGGKKYKKYVDEVFVRGVKSIFDRIPKVNLKNGLEKKKKKPKEVTLLQEDCQAFGILVGKAHSLDEAFKYPLTSVPLSIAESWVDLYSADKSGFRNDIIQTANASEKKYPLGAVWIIDGMAYVQSLPAATTYGEYFEKLLCRMMPSAAYSADQLIIVMDTYLRFSAKEGTRNKRGEKSARVHITGLGQHMPKETAFRELLSNSDNKTDLIHLFVTYLKTETVMQRLAIPIIVTDVDETWSITKDKVEMIFKCDHEEADSRMILHALLSLKDCVICAKDTDVLILMIFACSKFKVLRHWLIMYESGLFANIRTIVEHLGSDICDVLPQFHTLTGCDTTSYFFKAGKIKPFHKMLKNRGSTGLITNLGCDKVLNRDDIENCMKFIQTIVYNGKKEETYVQTRIRLYKKQNKKTSRSLPPDPSSCHQAILRAHHQAYQYLRISKKLIKPLPLSQNGWIINDEGVIPLWFTCSQLPPSIPLRVNTKQNEDVNDADDESVEPDENPKRRKKGKKVKTFKQLYLELEKDAYSDDDGDDEEDEDEDEDEEEGKDKDHYDEDDDSADEYWEHYSDFRESNSDSDSDW